MHFMTIIWKIHYDYKKKKYENKCKSQYKEYLKYLEKKQIIPHYISMETILN